MAAGFVIVIACVVVVSRLDPKHIEAKIIVGILGGIGTILTNYIGSIYLKMHAGTIQSLTQFHNRLVGTNRLHYAYMLASKISSDAPGDDPKLLDKTLAAMALQVANPEVASAKVEAAKSDKSSEGTKPDNKSEKPKDEHEGKEQHESTVSKQGKSKTPENGYADSADPQEEDMEQEE